MSVMIREDLFEVGTLTCGLTSRWSQPPLALAVPLSRFTSRVGGGSAFYVRPHYTLMKTHKLVSRVILTCGALVSGYATLAFLVWLYPSAIGAKGVPLQGVTIQGFHLDRTGMLLVSRGFWHCDD